MSEPIFLNTVTALAVSHAAEVSAAYPKSSTRVVIENLMRNSGQQFDVSRKVNAEGLTPVQFFAQCARIRDIVEKECGLTFPEIYSIWAKYGCGVRQLVGFGGIAKDIEINTKNKGLCLIDVVRSIFDKQLTIRGVSDKHDVSLTSIRNDQLTVKGYIRGLENSAEKRIDEELAERGLVGELVVVPVRAQIPVC